ncbi:hypothetical protein [Streptacidiphilus cavernicola]|uniref:Uncharacterized protein n=1 Tax=Streptacidiphilus cavernicola TaxID=3342716 RepID=A0ABV6VYH9_9ACTN
MSAHLPAVPEPEDGEDFAAHQAMADFGQAASHAFAQIGQAVQNAAARMAALLDGTARPDPPIELASALAVGGFGRRVTVQLRPSQPGGMMLRMSKSDARTIAAFLGQSGSRRFVEDPDSLDWLLWITDPEASALAASLLADNP